MARMTWGQAGTKKFESGVDRGVLYLADGSGVPWNGLTQVVESNTDEHSDVYYEGVKVRESVSVGEFKGTLRALTFPDEFLELEGVTAYRSGLLFTDQKPIPFGLSYRTMIGTDQKAADASTAPYKIHILYNLKATATDKTYVTMGESSTLVEFEWDISAVPVEVDGFHPMAHIVIDTSTAHPSLVTYVETLLYGDATTDGSLPSIENLMAALVGLWLVQMLPSGVYPSFMTVDNLGNVYTINNNGTISRLSSTDVLTHPFNGTTLPAGAIAVCVTPNRDLYILHNNNTITKVTSTGTVTANWKTGLPVYAKDICCDPTGTNLFTSHHNASGGLDFGKVSKIVIATQGLTSNWATVGVHPDKIVADANGNVFTMNSGNNTVSKCTSVPVVTTSWAQCDSPVQDMCIDSLGNIFVLTNKTESTITKIRSNGDVTKIFATVGNSATNIAVDSKRNLWVTNVIGRSISKVSRNGIVIRDYGLANIDPSDIAASPVNSSIYVTLSGSSQVCRVGYM